MKKERLIGLGVEHQVFQYTRYDQRSLKRVIKRPQPYVVKYLRDKGLGADELKEQFKSAQSLIANTRRVRIPPTRVFDTKKMGFGTGYVISQNFVQSDNTVPNIRKALVEEDIPKLVDLFDRKQSNFIGSNGMIFWVDPVEFFDVAIEHTLRIPMGKIDEWLLRLRRRRNERRFR